MPVNNEGPAQDPSSFVATAFPPFHAAKTPYHAALTLSRLGIPRAQGARCHLSRSPSSSTANNLANEISHLRQHKQTRAIPARVQNRLLIATWNIANFGVQQRTGDDRKLISEIISWFDIFAVQETHENYGDLADVHDNLGGSWRFVMSDRAGNDERLAFLYDSAKVTLLEEIGEVAFPPKDNAKVSLPGIAQAFDGFDRNPYFATFQAGQFTLLLATVHLFFGSDKQKKDIDRRSLETFAVARWADREATSQTAYTRNLLVLGDFNMPKADPADPIYKAVTKKGLQVPGHSSQVGSSIASDAHYDQIARGALQSRTELKIPLPAVRFFAVTWL